MWQQIYLKLKNKGLNPYAPGHHEGLCTESYCVIREGTQMPSVQGKRVGYRVVEVIAFVPAASYVQLAPYVEEIKAALNELPFLRKTGNETPVVTDDEVKAYTTSVQYQIMKKLEG